MSILVLVAKQCLIIVAENLKFYDLTLKVIVLFGPLNKNTNC